MTDVPLKLKIMMTGNTGSGTSSLTIRYVEDRFETQHTPTIGIDFHIKTLLHLGVKLQLWEAAGGQRFRVVTRTYYRGAQGIIITYNITDRYSFESVQRWYHEIEDSVEGLDAGVIVYIVGTHLDKEDRREVLYGEGEELALSLGCKFFEVSSRDGTNVSEMFQQLAVDMMESSSILPVREIREGKTVKLWKQGERHRSCC